jgi:hypothetical protein
MKVKILTSPDPYIPVDYVNVNGLGGDGKPRECFFCKKKFKEFYVVDTGAVICTDCLKMKAEEYGHKLETTVVNIELSSRSKFFPGRWKKFNG